MISPTKPLSQGWIWSFERESAPPVIILSNIPAPPTQPPAGVKTAKHIRRRSNRSHRRYHLVPSPLQHQTCHMERRISSPKKRAGLIWSKIRQTNQAEAKSILLDSGALSQRLMFCDDPITKTNVLRWSDSRAPTNCKCIWDCSLRIIWNNMYVLHFHRLWINLDFYIVYYNGGWQSGSSPLSIIFQE